MKPKLEKTIVAAYLGDDCEQHSIRDIAEWLGVTYTAVRDALRRRNIPLRQRGRTAAETTERRCNVCLCMKPLKLFNKDKTRAGGYSYRCASCHPKRLRQVEE